MSKYVAVRKPYWMNLWHPRGYELQWELNNYPPLAHYDHAVTELADRLDGEAGGGLVSEGGYREMDNGLIRMTVFNWVEPDTGIVQT